MPPRGGTQWPERCAEQDGNGFKGRWPFAAGGTFKLHVIAGVAHPHPTLPLQGEGF
jgi:hypothetical protein